MATRKDLLKAHSFVTQRLIAALVGRRADSPEPPLRRVGTAGFASIMIGIIVTAGFGVVGLLRGGSSTAWQNDTAVIINSETGTVYAFIDKKLFPAVNVTSARLATGGASVKTLKSRSLRGYPTENPIGIPGAPQQLPDVDDLATFPLRVCSTAPEEDHRFVTLEVGTGQVPGTSQAFAAQDRSGTYYLVTEGRRFPIPTPEQGRPPLLTNLGFNSSARLDDRWLNTLPAGPELTPITVPKEGQPSLRRPPSGDGRIGGFYRTSGDRPVDYVLAEEGLVAITPLEGEIARAAGKESVEISPDEASTYAAPDDISMSDPDMPSTIPDAPTSPIAEESICATWTDSTSPPKIAIGAPTPDVVATPGEDDPRSADTVVIPTLQGALVTPAKGSSFGVLLTEGKRFGIASAEDVKALGYADHEVDQLPDSVIALVPQGLGPGSQLSKSEALQPIRE